MVWNFDPRKLVKDQQEEENKKIEDVIMNLEKNMVLMRTMMLS